MSDRGGVIISALSVTGCVMGVGLYLHCLLQGDGGGVISALSVTGCLMGVGLYLHCLLQGV